MKLNEHQLESMALRVVQGNPETLYLAQNLTKSPFSYSRLDVEHIVIKYLRNTSYDNKCIDKLIELHPDKPIFDIYYKRKSIMKKENKKYNCIGCGTFSSEGNGVEEESKTKKILNQIPVNKVIFWGLAGLAIYTIIKEKNN